MPRTRPAYPPQLPHHMVGLVRSGIFATELTRDFECRAGTIRKLGPPGGPRRRLP